MMIKPVTILFCVLCHVWYFAALLMLLTILSTVKTLYDALKHLQQQYCTFLMFLLTFFCVYFYVCILLCAASGE